MSFVLYCYAMHPWFWVPRFCSPFSLDGGSKLEVKADGGWAGKSDVLEAWVGLHPLHAWEGRCRAALGASPPASVMNRPCVSVVSWPRAGLGLAIGGGRCPPQCQQCPHAVPTASPCSADSVPPQCRHCPPAVPSVSPRSADSVPPQCRQCPPPKPNEC